jgi:hypothetical protein
VLWRRVVPFSVRKPAVPFKHLAAHRHHIPKQRYRVTNWREYDAALRRRGRLTVWFTDEAIALSCYRKLLVRRNGTDLGVIRRRRSAGLHPGIRR